MTKKGKKTLKGKKEELKKRMKKIFKGKFLFCFFFYVGHVTKKLTNQGTNILRFDPKKRNDDGNAKCSSPIGQFWSRDPHPAISLVEFL